MTMDELKNALDRIKLVKAAGYDEIATEFLKFMGDSGQETLPKVINMA